MRQLLTTGCPYILALSVILITTCILIDKNEKREQRKRRQLKMKEYERQLRIQQYKSVEIDLNIWDEIRELNPS